MQNIQYSFPGALMTATLWLMPDHGGRWRPMEGLMQDRKQNQPILLTFLVKQPLAKTQARLIETLMDRRHCVCLTITQSKILVHPIMLGIPGLNTIAAIVNLPVPEVVHYTRLEWQGVVLPRATEQRKPEVPRFLSFSPNTICWGSDPARIKSRKISCILHERQLFELEIKPGTVKNDSSTI